MRLSLLLYLICRITFGETCLVQSLVNPLNKRHIERVKKYLGVDEVIVLGPDHLGSSHGVYFPGANKVAVGEKMAKDISGKGEIILSHELRHALLTKYLKEGKLTPYHGHLKVQGGDGKIPGLEKSGYGEYISFEESLTHFEDSRKYLRQLKRGIELPTDQREVLVERFFFNTQAGLNISRGINKNLVALEKSIDPSKVKSRQGPFGRELIYRHPDFEGEIKFFVANEKGNPEELFLRRLKESQIKISDEAAKQFAASRLGLLLYMGDSDPAFTIKAFESALDVGKRRASSQSILYRSFKGEKEYSEVIKVLETFITKGEEVLLKGQKKLTHPDYDFDLLFDTEGNFLNVL